MYAVEPFLNGVILDEHINENKKIADLEMNLASLSARLHQSNESLEQFAYAVSHDFREPLRMVASYLQLLDMENGDKFDAESKEFMKTACDGARKMNAMLDGLLMYSRVSTQGKPFLPCCCEEIIQDATNNLTIQISDSGAEITIKSLPEKIIGDKLQIAAVFTNLIDNAIKFAKPQVAAKIEISCCDNGGEWLFCVCDNGIGIEPDYYERVFKIFYRGEASGKTQGCGIGLAICRRIIERHSGRIWLQSEQGQGTRFFFNLPKQPLGV